MKKIRIGIAGYGIVGAKRLACILKHKDTDIVAICDRNKHLGKSLDKNIKFFKNIKTDIPTLYIMGNKDYMFLSSIKKIVKTQPNAILEIFKNCGHVVNIEYPDKFNDTSLKFLKD